MSAVKRPSNVSIHSLKRQAILEFCYDYIACHQEPLTTAQITAHTGWTNISNTVWMDDLDTRKSHPGVVIMGARLPGKPWVRVPEVFYDKDFGVWREDSVASVPRMERRCLCCCRQFLAVGKFNRLCVDCSNEAAEAAPDQGYVGNMQAILTNNIGGYFRKGGA